MAITFHPDGRIIDSSGNDLAYKPIYDVWQLTGNLTGNQDIIAGSAWTRSSTTNTNKSGAHTNVGSAMSVDSTGYWTFPSSGKWEVTFSANFQSVSGAATRCVNHTYISHKIILTIIIFLDLKAVFMVLVLVFIKHLKRQLY